MVRILKILVAIGLGLVVVSLLVVYGISEWRMNQEYAVSDVALSLPGEVGDPVRGEHLVRAVSVCVDCHGDDLSGEHVEKVPLLARVTAPNLTPGAGGIGESSERELVLAIRHALSNENKPLIVMPSQNFYYLSDDDLAAVLAYLRTVPPVEGHLDQGNPGLLIRGPMIFDMFALLPAAQIDHNAPRPDTPEEAANAKYGSYLVAIAGCRDCHGTPLSGGRVPGFGPSAPDLTMTGNAARWDLEDFMLAMREGTTSAGQEIDSIMPWRYYAGMTDLELTAIHEYLQTLPVEGTLPADD
ncbi:MAG: hypothetical protein Kow00122_12070 [Thermoleophilia bacterium]